jgi:hypothetical protein
VCGVGEERANTAYPLVVVMDTVSLEWEQVVVDSRDAVALGGWWAEALGWVVLNDPAEEYEIRPSADRLLGLIFVPVPEAKESKNRLHLDLRPDDQQAEPPRDVRRLHSLGG